MSCRTYKFLYLSSFILFLFAVFIREIKEVRRGLGSKDFDRNPESARRLDPNCCLAIFYGNEFKLKTLSLVGKINKGFIFSWLSDNMLFLKYNCLGARFDLIADVVVHFYS